MSVALRDLGFGVATLLAAALYFTMAVALRASDLDDPIGAAGAPKLLAGIIGLLGLLLVAKALRQLRSGTAQRSVAVAWRGFGFIAIGAAYAAIAPLLGYGPAIALAILSVALFMGARPGLATLLLGAVLGGAFWVFFVKLLGTMQPAGAIAAAFGLR
jgi:hypothetical protein